MSFKNKPTLQDVREPRFSSGKWGRSKKYSNRTQGYFFSEKSVHDKSPAKFIYILLIFSLVVLFFFIATSVWNRSMVPVEEDRIITASGYIEDGISKFQELDFKKAGESFNRAEVTINSEETLGKSSILRFIKNGDWFSIWKSGQGAILGIGGIASATLYTSIVE